MKYRVIYADPPWSFGNKMYSSGNGGFQRDISLTYGTMKTKDICALNVNEVSDDDCALFMWTTDAHIPDALKVIEAWGFEYKTVAFIWRKTEKSGVQTCYMGQWTTKNCEIVLFATKGKMKKYLKSRRVRQLQDGVRRKHSQKPDIIREKIVEMFGDVPRLEMFTREKYDGWDVFGNEVDGSVEIK